VIARVTGLAITVVLVGCHGRDVPTGSAPRDAAPDVPRVITAPHSGTIRLLAVTDAGDAALTADTFEELRLWPRLDGTREPVGVRGNFALAAIDEHGSGDSKLARWIALGDRLAWGESVALPVALGAKLAIEPGGHRLLGVAPAAAVAVVIDLDAKSVQDRIP